MSGKQSAADLLVGLAVERYELARSSDGEPFAIEVNGPNVARLFRGGRASLRAALAALYAEQMGKVPPAQALIDALAVLEGQALSAPRRPLPLRATSLDNRMVIIDLGDEAGKAIVLNADGWHLKRRSPVTFRRSELTAPLPEPAASGDLGLLLELLNCDADDHPLVLAVLIAALLGVPCPILLLRGPAGAAKTTLARMLARVVDPSPAPVRSVPRDPESWAVSAAGSYIVVLDNLTHISEWLSDALCRAVTGEGFLRRALYTDAAISVVAFRRCIVLTAIDPGAMRGDLADRLLAVELRGIAEEDRLDESEVEARFRKAHPRILAGLLDLTTAVLNARDVVKLERRPRMADFGVILASVDAVMGTSALARYLEQRGELQREAAEGDRIGSRVMSWLNGRTEWEGTAAELLAELTPERPSKDWPTTPRGLAGALRRVAQPLAAAGIEVSFTRESGSGARRLVNLQRSTPHSTVATVATVASDRDPRDGATVGDGSDGAFPTYSGRSSYPEYATDDDGEVVP